MLCAINQRSAWLCNDERTTEEVSSDQNELVATERLTNMLSIFKHLEA